MRVLLVGGGCRGLALARDLVSDGHAVRAVTRTEAGCGPIEAAGAECWIGTPDAVGTLRYALENVTILVWALATATGSRDEIAPLHGSRLAMMLEKTIDTTVRGVVYEACGSADEDLLAAGAAELRQANQRNEIPIAVLDADPADRDAWARAARGCIERLLAAR